MTTLLYVTAHPFEADTFSLSVSRQFMKTYRDFNPEDTIVHLDLYKSDIPQLDADLLQRWGQPPSGPSFDELSPEAKAKSVRAWGLVEQFVAADKIVIANPVWNLLFPPVLKAYLDLITVPGMTIMHADNGLRGLDGLVGAVAGKKVVQIQASGTVLSHGKHQELNFSSHYLKAALKLLGIEDFQSIYVEGMAQYKEQAQEIKDRALQQASEMAKEF
ncbi:NAD(P)H-dependent oxidoreductase [Paenibacillus pasadenensis]|uniref:FMN-dependent NADH-azoreductase n=1 Tax=Paenibacillus pasadenensis TaxID=217090 RepID=UPI00203DC772|nr:NAD(P)H-dependent oxidoreductase [Paenibacillus pasadenensis]MCM3748626.1 NAD(P)H-dependent oxidoreductase [Paenibacillus pasadenensis]